MSMFVTYLLLYYAAASNEVCIITASWDLYLKDDNFVNAPIATKKDTIFMILLPCFASLFSYAFPVRELKKHIRGSCYFILSVRFSLYFP